MEPVSVIRAVLTIRKTHRERYESVEDWSVRLMWCSRGCLGPHATSVACLWHVSVVGGARRRGCAAGGVSVMFNRLLAGASGSRDRELIGAIVELLVLEARARLMAAHPVPAHRGQPLDLGVERGDQVLVLDRLARGGLPALALPARQPRGHRVEHQLRVRDHDHLRVVRQRAQALQRRGELHPVVGGELLAAGELDRRRSLRWDDDRRPATGAGIAAAGTVRPDDGFTGAGFNWAVLAHRGPILEGGGDSLSTGHRSVPARTPPRHAIFALMDNELMDDPKSEIDWRAVQTAQLGISGFIVFLMVVIWFATGVGYFWPIWVWFGLSIPIAIQYAIRRARQGPRQWRALSIHAALSCVAGVILSFIWVLTG